MHTPVLHRDATALPPHWADLWRASVEPPQASCTPHAPNIPLYVRAPHRKAAFTAVWNALQAMFNLTADQARNMDLYVESARELIDEGVSANHAYRLFETRDQDERVWVSRPVFAVHDAAQLHEAWSMAQRERPDGRPLLCRDAFANDLPRSLEINTRHPSKWLAIDLESGDVWQGDRAKTWLRATGPNLGAAASLIAAAQDCEGCE